MSETETLYCDQERLTRTGIRDDAGPKNYCVATVLVA